MTTRDLWEETYSAVTVNKVRTSLTMLGIVIGIASVIAMVAIGQGSQSSIQSKIQSLGSNLLMVTPGAQRSFGSMVRGQGGTAKTLTVDDVTAIASDVDNIAAMAREVSGRYQVVYKGNNTNASVIGTESSYATVRNVTMDQGDFITDADVTNSSRNAVIGQTVLTSLFATTENASPTADMAIGNTIRINSNNFKVVGVATSSSNANNDIFVPLSTAQHILFGSDKYYSEVDVEASSQSMMTQVQEDITSLLLTRHKISDSSSADFTVTNQSEIVSAASSVTSTFTTLLAAIASISLLVGGIGIMNMMLTTVTERTREIGLRKALGAKERDITLQFLAESVLMTFVGGIIGVVLGWLIAIAISYFESITTSISIPYVLMAFCVSAAIGIIFGYYPARRAAKLNPIEALRYE